MLQRFYARPRLAPTLIMAAALAALAIAYASEVWGGLQPCILCYYQRYAYGVAFGFGLIGVLLAGWPTVLRACLALAGLSFLAGAGIAAFHVGVEQHWWRGTAECHAPVFDPSLSIDQLREQMLSQSFVPCDEVQWSLFGLSMAAYNVIASLLLAAASLWLAVSPRRHGGWRGGRKGRRELHA
ncbi:MAG: disulfide bond formation protein B [Kiloniellales bacterium]